MRKKSLKKIGSSRVAVFRINNRRGYAAICLNNLTEGKTPAEAFRRLIHPLRRMGLELIGDAPRPRSA
jgi:hypothetical protein